MVGDATSIYYEGIFSKIGKIYLTSDLLELDFRGVVLFCYRGKVDPSFGSNFFFPIFLFFLVWFMGHV